MKLLTQNVYRDGFDLGLIKTPGYISCMQVFEKFPPRVFTNCWRIW